MQVKKEKDMIDDVGTFKSEQIYGFTTVDPNKNMITSLWPPRLEKTE